MPALNAEVLANFLDVGDQVPCGFASMRRIWRALATAALVEVHDSVLFGVEEAALFGILSHLAAEGRYALASLADST